MQCSQNMSLDSETLWQQALALSPGGVHSPVRAFQSVGGTPVFFKKAKGPYLWDTSGRRYIDFCMSFGPLILGHCDPDVLGIVQRTAKTAWSLGSCEPYSLALAEFISEELPWVEKIRFVSSGTEAVMSALRLARAATQRDGILKFEGCYHGHVDSLLVRSGSGLAEASLSDSAGISQAQIQHTYVLPLDNEAALEAFFAKEGEKIAVVIIEPLPANYGLLVQRESFLRKVAQLSKEYGALLLFDEVISGFRVGLQGMAGLTGIQPDLLCLGKVIGGGFPVGAYGGRGEIMDLVAPKGPVYQAGTLSANPFGMRAGLATLEKCKQEEVYRPLEKNTRYFCKALTDILNQNTDWEWEAPCFASLFWIRNKTQGAVRSIDKIPEQNKKSYAYIFHLFLEQGIYLSPSAFEVSFLSTAHSKKVLNEALGRIERALKKSASHR